MRRRLCSCVSFMLMVACMPIEAALSRRQGANYLRDISQDNEVAFTGLVGPSGLVGPYRPYGVPMDQARKRPQRPQVKQTMQETKRKETWKYPEMPEESHVPVAHFELVEPAPADSVVARCGEADVQVEVNQDFFGTGQLISPMDLFLGDCPAVGQDPSSRVIFLQSELHECNSRLELTENELVYTFTLTYIPKAFVGFPILRTNHATVDIECHYPSVHNVSSQTIVPKWLAFSAAKAGEDILLLSLRLMTDDWAFERGSNMYYLGDLLNIEAHVVEFSHVPLQVSVGTCVATADPDTATLPSYSFIGNNGCFLDAKVTGSRSRFLPITQDDLLRFQLEVFRFAEERENTIYITCELMATTASTESPQRACSYSSDGWLNAKGENHEICRCCDSTCEPTRMATSTGQSKGEELRVPVTMGPILVRGKNKKP